MAFFSILMLPLTAAAAVASTQSGRSPDYPRIDDFQIAWVVPSEELAKQMGNKELPGDAWVTLEMVPERLFKTVGEVSAADGTLLLPDGSQLYFMIGPKLMACSQQTKADDRYAASGNRVCLLDNDGDKKFDVYFLRSSGRSFWTTDQMWFAMNHYVPKERPALKPMAYEEIDRTNASIKASITLIFDTRKNGQLGANTVFEKTDRFYGGCIKERNEGDVTYHSCFADDFKAKTGNLSGAKARDRKLWLTPPKRDMIVRFDVSARLMGNRLMKGYSIK